MGRLMAVVALSAVICREVCRAIRLGCGAQGVLALGVMAGSTPANQTCLPLPPRLLKLVYQYEHVSLGPTSHGYRWWSGRRTLVSVGLSATQTRHS